MSRSANELLTIQKFQPNLGRYELLHARSYACAASLSHQMSLLKHVLLSLQLL